MTKPLHELPSTFTSEMLYRYYSDLKTNCKNPVFVEVGAAHPEHISVSYTFRDWNWNIISLEANPEFCNEFRKRNFEILEYAACESDRGLAEFKISPNLVCSSGLEIGDLDRIGGWFGWTEKDFRTVQVQALTLNTILNRHHPDLNHIDILMIDVEGYELKVLDGLDLKKYSPDLICIENVHSYPEYYEYMNKIDYRLIHKELQDEIYVKKNNE